MIKIRLTGGAHDGKELMVSEGQEMIHLRRPVYEPIQGIPANTSESGDVCVYIPFAIKMTTGAGHRHFRLWVPSDWDQEQVLRLKRHMMT